METNLIEKKIGRSGALMILRKVWGGILNLMVMAYLARKLEAADFGLVAITSTIQGLIQSLTNGGIGDFIIYYGKEDKQEIQNAAFWLNFFFVTSICLLIIIFYPVWGIFYGDKRIHIIIFFLISIFFSSVLNVVPLAILQKKLDFQKIIPTQMLLGTLSQISQAVFAWRGFGVFSLILPSVIFTPILGLILINKSGFLPNVKHWGINRWKEIFSYSKHVMFSNFITKFANEGDTLLVGKLLGAQALGLYDIAFKLSNIFNQNLLPILTSITTPIFAHNQDNLKKLQSYYIIMVSTISFFSFPIAGTMIVFAPDLILILYGDKWIDAVLPLQLFCVFAAFRSLGSPTSSVYNAIGLPKIGFRITVIFTILLFISIYLSSQWGLISICIAVTTIRTLGTCVHFFTAEHLLKFGIRNFWAVIQGPLIASFLSVCLLFYIPYKTNIWQSPIFVIVFLIIMRIFYFEILKRNFLFIRQITTK